MIIILGEAWLILETLLPCMDTNLMHASRKTDDGLCRNPTVSKKYYALSEAVEQLCVTRS
jgi:hypothetical protein